MSGRVLCALRADCDEGATHRYFAKFREGEADALKRGLRVGFQLPTTIADAIRRIQSDQLVLPAIQREFVWEDEQVTRLFDSVARGYPIGSFLSWAVGREAASQFRIYGFLRLR